MLRDYNFSSIDEKKMIQEEIEILKQVGHRLRYYRKLRNLTQEQLGEEANVSYKYIGEIERGGKNVGLIVILRLARALQVSMMDLMDCHQVHSGPQQKCLKSIIRLLEKSELEEIQKAQRLLKIFFTTKGT